MIIVPDSLANQLETEALARSAAEADRARTERRASMKWRLQAGATVLTDPAAVAAVRQLCCRLLNLESRIVIGDRLTAGEIGRLVSDVLLGDGQEYEIKT